MTRPVPRSETIRVEGRRLHVACWGDPGRPALLLLHGMRDHARSWDWTANALADRYHVMAPDFRGHGDSDPVEQAGYSIAGFIMDVVDTVAAFELASLSIVGHSLGGAIGLRYAAAFPEKVRAFCGIECVELPIVRDHANEPRAYPVRLREWADLEQARRLRAPHSYASIGDAAARMQTQHPALDVDTIEHLTRHALRRDADNQWRWKYDNAARIRAPDDADGRDLDETLDALSCPTLLCYGDASWIPIPSGARLNRIADLRVRTFPGVSHWLHHEARHAFVAELSAFLDHVSESHLHA